MTEQTRPDQTPDQTGPPTPKWMIAIIGLVALLLVGLVAAPMALSGKDIMDWARNGLGLPDEWPWIVFYALDATAIIGVLVCFWSAWQGQRSGLFQLTVWSVAGVSAFAQFRHGDRIRETAPDAWWFFPIMAIVAPFMLELVLAKVRMVQRQRKGQVAAERPKFGFWNWIPGVGSFTETYGAWRISRLMNISTYEGAVRAYRTLCPSGGVRVLKALRAQQLADQTGPASNWKASDRTTKQTPPKADQTPDQKKKKADQTSKPVRRTVNLYTNPDQTYITAITADPMWPETSLKTIQDLVKEKCPTGKCGKERAIRLRKKAKELKK